MFRFGGQGLGKIFVPLKGTKIYKEVFPNIAYKERDHIVIHSSSRQVANCNDPKFFVKASQWD